VLTLLGLGLLLALGRVVWVWRRHRQGDCSRIGAR
jgi:hypothetical protein